LRHTDSAAGAQPDKQSSSLYHAKSRALWRTADFHLLWQLRAHCTTTRRARKHLAIRTSPDVGQERFGAACGVGADQDRGAVPHVVRDLCQTVVQDGDVVSGGVRSCSSRAQDRGQGFVGVVQEAGHRVVAEGLLTTAVGDLDDTIKVIRSTIFALSEHGAVERVPGLRAQVLEVCQDVAGPLGFAPAVRFTGPVDYEVPEGAVEHTWP
jgi:hypothetical protein